MSQARAFRSLAFHADGNYRRRVNVPAIRSIFLRLSLCLMAFGLSPVTSAQEGPPDPLAIPPGPAQEYAVSEGGVDMRTGQHTYAKTELQMGGVGGLSLTRNQGSNDYKIWQPMGQFAHNWHIYVNYKATKGGSATFAVGGARGAQFVAGTNTNNFIANSASNRSSLEAVPTGSGALERYFIYTGSDGTKITFRPQGGFSDRADRGVGPGDASYYAEKIEEPSGVTYTLAYDAPTATIPAFLRRVQSNTGYTLIFEWVTNPVETFVSKACLFNDAVDVVPTANSCAGAAYSVSYTYGSNGTMTAALGADGNTHSYASTYNEAAWQAAINNWPNTNYNWTESFTNPGDTNPYLTNTIYRNIFVENVESQDFAEGADYTYAWNVTEHNEASMEVAGGTMTRSDGATKTVQYQEMTRPGYVYGDSYVISEGPRRIVDELGRELTSDYCVTIVVGGGGGFPYAQGCASVSARYWKYPDGNQTDFTYDGWGNVLEAKTKPKPGSSEPDLVTTYTYDCSTVVNCHKPISVTDPEGNVTNAEYDTTHGGILKRTLPADANGVRPETRYTYTQKTAWKKSGGGFAASSPPVWLLTSEEYCKTSAADANGNCGAGASDEVVTTYEYQQGNATTGSNLLLLGTAVTADGQTLRTCFTYDNKGRKISETQPLGVSGVCP